MTHWKLEHKRGDAAPALAGLPSLNRLTTWAYAAQAAPLMVGLTARRSLLWKHKQPCCVRFTGAAGGLNTLAAKVS